MISKNKISELKKLSQKKFRAESGLFIAEGTKSVEDLLASSLPVEELFATTSWLQAHQGQLADIAVTEVTITELERITALTTPQQVLAVVRAPHFTPADLDFSDALLVLDGIRDPGNLGTILRTADWFGFRQVLCSPDCVEWTNPKTIQATMGSFTRVKVIYADVVECLQKPQRKGTVYGTFMQGEPIQNIDFQKNDILIVGNEGKGISPEVAQCVQQRVSVPLASAHPTHAESLNASIAAAIVMYEFRR